MSELPEVAGRRDQSGQSCRGNPEPAEEVSIPGQRAKAQKLRPRRSRCVRSCVAPVQTRRQPCVHGPEAQPTLGRRRAHFFVVLEQPGELAGGVVRVERQARALPDRPFQSRGTKTLDDRERAPALPADRGGERPAILGIPGNDRLALVGQPGSNDALRAADLLQHARHRQDHGIDDRLWVLLDPARRRMSRFEPDAGARDRPEASIEGDRSR